MKGIVFNVFSDLVTEKFGIETWDALIDATNPQSNAVYTSSQVYEDEELLAYVAELARITGVAAADLVRAFGTYMMYKFEKMHPEFLAGHSAKTLLESVHGVIHIEVKKLHPDALLPTFEYESTGPKQLTMIYSSPRKLCHLAEGLIIGTGEIFSEAIDMQHTECMLKGAEKCRLELSFG